MADLTALATRGDKVLGLLESSERDALARGYLRFQIDREADLFVVAPRGSVPFWVSNLGFELTAMTHRERAMNWVVYGKRFQAGWVGLGVNGLRLPGSSKRTTVVSPSPCVRWPALEGFPAEPG